MAVNVCESDTYELDFESGFRAGVDFARSKYDKIVERMILAGEDIVKIMEYTKFTREEIEEVRENLKRKCSGWCHCSRMEMDERVKYEEGIKEGKKRAREEIVDILVSIMKGEDANERS